MKVLLSLDMSTTCTGWALFNIETHGLITSGIIKGKTFKDSSPQRATLKKMVYIASAILNIIDNYKPTRIVIEEIAGSKNRIGQKTLDMLHGVVWMYIDQYLDFVEYYDVTGAAGWRTHLNLRLTEADKANNKEAKKINKTLDSKSRLPIYDAKDLAARYVNKTYNLQLDPQQNQYDADLADAIAMGNAYLKFKCPN